MGDRAGGRHVPPRRHPGAQVRMAKLRYSSEHDGTGAGLEPSDDAQAVVEPSHWRALADLRCAPPQATWSRYASPSGSALDQRAWRGLDTPRLAARLLDQRSEGSATRPTEARSLRRDGRRRGGRGSAGRMSSGMPMQALWIPASAASPDASAGHRGWKRQPVGIRVGSGISPFSTTGSSCSISGTTESSACVYGC